MKIRPSVAVQIGEVLTVPLSRSLAYCSFTFPSKGTATGRGWAAVLPYRRVAVELIHPKHISLAVSVDINEAEFFLVFIFRLLKLGDVGKTAIVIEVSPGTSVFFDAEVVAAAIAVNISEADGKMVDVCTTTLGTGY